MGIPPELTVEITGAAARPDRATLWQSRRAFFVTPQATAPVADASAPPALSARDACMFEGMRASH